MLSIRAVEEVPLSPGFYSTIFAVPKVERGVVYGQRVILNLKVIILFCLLMQHSRMQNFVTCISVLIYNIAGFKISYYICHIQYI